jgi:hypothetical protein
MRPMSPPSRVSKNLTRMKEPDLATKGRPRVFPGANGRPYIFWTVHRKAVDWDRTGGSDLARKREWPEWGVIRRPYRPYRKEKVDHRRPSAG